MEVEGQQRRAALRSQATGSCVDGRGRGGAAGGDDGRVLSCHAYHYGWAEVDLSSRRMPKKGKKKAKQSLAASPQPEPEPGEPRMNRAERRAKEREAEKSAKKAARTKVQPMSAETQKGKTEVARSLWSTATEGEHVRSRAALCPAKPCLPALVRACVPACLPACLRACLPACVPACLRASVPVCPPVCRLSLPRSPRSLAPSLLRSLAPSLPRSRYPSLPTYLLAT